ncbi:prismalin-14-like [Centruroides vittatus]|uniref:prismalin-14-like n=1 Tax=Centruroides vittatus TaxID=120091 RepID=UPI00350FBEAD
MEGTKWLVLLSLFALASCSFYYPYDDSSVTYYQDRHDYHHYGYDHYGHHDRSYYYPYYGYYGYYGYNPYDFLYGPYSYGSGYANQYGYYK